MRSLGGAATLAPVPFHGAHQAGILTPQPPAAAFVAFDAIAPHRADLAELLRTLTARARFLTTGGVPPELGGASPPSDSGTLGPRVPADGLTVTVGVGSTLFDGRYGLAALKPRHLDPMRAFPNDDLDPAFAAAIFSCRSVPAVQMSCCTRCATLRSTPGAECRFAGVSMVTSPHRAQMASGGTTWGSWTGLPIRRWRSRRWPTSSCGWCPGPASPAGPSGGRTTWSVSSGCSSSSGTGCRLTEQQNMIGRYRANGAPIGMTSYRDVPDYAKDPYGLDVPLSAHMRVANPRTAATEPSRIYRRSYNYDLGTDLNGDLNMGHAFNCFQQDVTRQFEVVQARLVNEALDDYVSPFGGGYFFALPGVRDGSDWYGRGLLA